MELSDRYERGLLGALLRWPAALDDVVPVLRADQFRLTENGPEGRLFRTLVEMQAASRPIDLVTVADELHKREWMDDCGGYAGLAGLWDSEPTGANAVYYAHKVRDAHLSRSIASLGHELVREGQGATQEPLEALAGFESALFALSEVGAEGTALPLGGDVDAACDAYDERVSGRAATGLSTGWIDLDRILAGLHGSELLVVAARPSVGKTAFAGSLARHLALHEGAPVFFASLEQSRKELAERLLCAEGRVDSHRFRQAMLSREEEIRIDRARDRLRPAPLYVDDRGEQSALRIAANARRLRRKHGIRVVIVDYLQLMQPEDKKQDRHLQVGAMSRRLKFLAKELDVPVVALAQLNRGVEERRGRPRLSDLRESGEIEQNADTVILLHRPEEPAGDVVPIEALVAKQRNGPTGDVTLAYHRPFLRFENYAPDFPA